VILFCIKFHQNPIQGLGIVAKTKIRDTWTTAAEHNTLTFLNEGVKE
jgi:hypothetical protein